MKFILLDVDGTLFNDDKKMMPETKKALIQAQNQGVRLVLASGRPTRGLEGIAEELEMDKHHGLLVAYNGSKVIDCQTKETLFNQALNVDEVRSILKHVKKFDGVTAMIDKGEDMLVTDIDGYKVAYETNAGGFNPVEVKDLAETIDFSANKILTSAVPEYLESIADELAEPFVGEINCMFTAPFYFEFTPLGVDKGKTMHQVFSQLGFDPKDMIAFGDAQNDISMLEYAGLGIAMGNATEEVKAVADEITLDNNNEGIAISLKKHGII